MFRRVNKGLTIIEVLIVLAISAGLAVISIGAFSSRGRTQADEAARLMMADIAKVRNEAVQGLGPTTSDATSRLAGNELFGQAIEFRTDSVSLGDTMRVYKLMLSGGTTISAYEYYDIPLSGGLKMYVPQSTSVSASPCNEPNFISCYYNYQLGITSYETLLEATTANRIIVVRNRTGETYTFSRAKTQPAGFDSNLGMSNGAAGAGAANLSNYAIDKQGRLRIAMGIPGNGSTSDAQMQAAPFKYYAIFDMQVPNNQELKVVK
jgi:prepilin-type N-terminal cleavage/methylation domain-containing protein